jgi:phytanoyl-CoA hydroxylase
MLNHNENTEFQDQGFLTVRNLIDPARIARLKAVVQYDWQEAVSPVEFETEVTLPDADPTKLQEGRHEVVRRLRYAFMRTPLFHEILTEAPIHNRLRNFLSTKNVVMPLGHHNCVMTKAPNGGSETQWHQDFRYWDFKTSNLVSVWVALGNEEPDNGCLRVIPGSHHDRFEASQFDSRSFFRKDAPQNQDLIESAIEVQLEPGDVLFFHCLTLHSAGPNLSSAPKFSAVFTFRDHLNPPTPGTRSAHSGEMVLPSGKAVEAFR